MNYALLWLDSLLVYLLWVAATLAITARFRWRWLRALLFPIVIGLPLLTLGMFEFATVTMKFVAGARPDWFAYATSLLVLYLIGAGFIVTRGRKREPGAAPAAAAWRRGPLVLSFLLALIISYIVLLNMDMAIRARCAMLGVKVSQEYWAAAPAVVSESQNAATLYEKIFARFKADMGQEVENDPVGKNENFTPNDPKTLAFLKRHEKTIQMLREAANLPACRFDSDLKSFETPRMDLIFTDDLNLERHCANVLWLHARQELADGHVVSAMADVDAIKHMSRQFAQRPMIISALVGLGVDAIGNAALAEALPRVKSPQDLAPLHLDNLESLGRTFQQALRGEEQVGLAFYSALPYWQGLDASKPPTQLTPDVGAAVSRVFFFDLDDYVNLMEKLQSASRREYYQVRQEMPELDRSSNPSTGLFTKIVAPSLSRAFETLADLRAGDDSARVAAAMTRYRLDHGKMPTALNELVPTYLDEVPKDPFDGKDLRLIVKNNQYLIYSVGPDLVDDHGKEIEKGKGDVVFTLAASAK